MRRLFYLLASMAVLFLSCSDDKGVGNFVPETYDVSGKVEKGPFISGSTVAIQPMDGNLQVLGNLYSSVIEDDLCNFSFGPRLFETPYASLMANGYFFNEIEGQLSAGTLDLRALVDLSDKSSVNVNILTHLKYQRIQKLMGGGMGFKDANKQAQQELFAAFGLLKYAEKDASTYSIVEGTDESSALIAISSLLLVDKSEAELTEYLAKLCSEFGEKGTFGENATLQMKTDKNKLRDKLPSVKNNIIERYRNLGIEVEVKDLTRFFDWDDDGIAGNEVLSDGQEVKLEVTELHVPSEGGVYAIGISSPIPVYLEPQYGSDEPPSTIAPDYWTSEIYENVVGTDIVIEKSITENELMIKVEPLNSRIAKSTSVELYDCLNNVIGTVDVIQEGNENATLPALGEAGKQVVNTFAMSLGQAFSKLNLIEQYYHYNKGHNLVEQYIYPTCSTVEDIWSAFYAANSRIQILKAADAGLSGLYQDYLNVFSAMLYYNMVVAWGDVPYVGEFSEEVNFNVGRTPQDEILSTLRDNMEKAMKGIEEKKNESLMDINSYFFLSKDVARVLLADIYMYQGEYPQAEKLLKEVIDNGFYKLDASNYNKQETITDLFNNGSSKELIFATHTEIVTRGTVSMAIPMLVPIMTYTDVILSFAECLYKNGKGAEAELQLKEITDAKGIQLTGNSILDRIKNARLQLMLYSDTNFAFMKRNNFAQDVYGVEEYRLLLPIPQKEIDLSTQMEQNPGY